MERLITEELKPGDLLQSERELVQMLGVSRTSARDAIRALELMGLLEPRQGIGTVVCSTATAVPGSPLAAALLEKRKLIADLLDLRRMIEPSLAGRAPCTSLARRLPTSGESLHASLNVTWLTVTGAEGHRRRHREVF